MTDAIASPSDAPRLRLSAALRRLIAAAVEVDPGAGQELTRLAVEAERLAAHLDTLPRAAEPGGSRDDAHGARGMNDIGPLTGPANPLAPPLRVWQEGNELHGSAVFGLPYEGPRGVVHGGVVAAAFDEVLRLAVSGAGLSGMTGTLTTRYRRPAPLDAVLRFRARVDRVEGRKIFTSADLHTGETLCAEAEAIFIARVPGRWAPVASGRRSNPNGAYCR